MNPKNQVFKLSPSSLHLMDDCPRCFWLTQHKLWKRPTGIFPSLPNGMDRILKTYFNLFRIKNQLPPELADQTDIKLFNDAPQLQIWQNNFKGISYTDEQGNILMGAVDDILIKNKKLVVLDFKTRGFPLKPDTTSYYTTQLNIYNYLLRKNNYETEDYSYLLFYITKEITEAGQIIFSKELIKINTDIKQAEATWRNALTILNNDCPKESCEWCSKEVF